MEKYNANFALTLKKEFDREPVYKKKLLETKIKSYGDLMVTHFHDKEVLKVGSDYTSLAVIMIDYALKNDEYYYPQAFLKECKYIKKRSG